jgi:tetratricopeptide (TPR) repeat protein
LVQRSVQGSERFCFKGSAAQTQALWAQRQAEVGNAAKARESAASAAVTRDRDSMEPAAIALAMAGDGSRAQALTEELARRFPSDTLLHQVTIPMVQAFIELERKAPEKAIQALQAATPYELGSQQGLLPIYARGQAYLQAKRGAEAEAEFQKIVDHRGVAAMSPVHSLAKLGLGRAYVRTGDSAKARAAYQDFLASWKDADADVPVLKEAKAEYAKLK